MKKIGRRKVPSVTPEQYAVEHPFVRWYATYQTRGAAKANGQDLMMGPLASKWFSIGVDDDLLPVLGVAEHDVEAIMSMKWTAAFLVRKTKQSDWVVLACQDSRIEAPRSDTAVPIRLWLPASPGLLDGWMDVAQPDQLKVMEAAIRKGRPEPVGSPLLTLPLKFKGPWTATAAAPKERVPAVV
jgi:hypothetical protein